MQNIQIPTPKPIFKKEKILQIRRENPKMSFMDISKKLGVHIGYVHFCLRGEKKTTKSQKILRLKKKFPELTSKDIARIVGAQHGYVQVCLKKISQPKPKVQTIPTQPQIHDKVNFVLEFLIQNPNFEMILTQEISTGKRILILK